MPDSNEDRSLFHAPTEYAEWVENEKAEFDLKIYNPATLLEHVTSALTYSLDAFDTKVAKVLGTDPWGYVAAQVNARPGARILSLGSGPCGVEITLAKSFEVPYELTCLDLNGQLLARGRELAKEAGVEILTLEQDANFLQLTQSYDVIFAHASLHHFIAFEHIFQHLHDHLSANGVFIAHEFVPRNGMRLWPRTKEVVDRLFQVLPARYRREGRGGAVHDTFPDVEYTQGTFECIRSEEIVGLLEKHFRVEAKILGQAFTRRFVDGGLGENYDLTREEDVVILNMLLTFDEMLTESGFLQAENVFMVMKRTDAA